MNQPFDAEFDLDQSLDDTVIFTFRENIDAYNMHRIKESIAEIVSNTSAIKIIYNFENITFLDSSGVGMFVGLKNQLAQVKATRFCYVKENILSSLEAMHLLKFFDIDKTLSEAKENLEP